MQLKWRDLVLVVGVVAGCSADAAGPSDPSNPPVTGPEQAAGRAAFSQNCASCHAFDGIDLAYFSFADSTIVRRAVAHVDSSTARRIVAYIHSLNSVHTARGTRLFQPQGATVASDVEFAVALFGQDTWPTLTTSQLRAINPLTTRIALPLPLWSEESSNLDWLADLPLPPGILAYDGNRAATALANYEAASTTANLAAAVAALRAAERAANNPAAPCLLFDATRANYAACFETRRAIGMLIAQHMLRSGTSAALSGELHEQWWDVGDAARLSAQFNKPVANASLNQVVWLYLGWMFDPSRHESFYLENALGGRGLSRHATFVALRSQVARTQDSWDEHESVYDDLRMAVRHTPPSWANAVTTFALTHILERLNAGERPVTAANKADATTQIDGAMNEVAKKVTATQLTALQALAAQAKSKL